MDNYRDIGAGAGDVSAGFQFEFNCQSCGDTWRSQFRPYRTGQLAAWLERFSFMVSGNASATSMSTTLATAGGRRARQKVLEEAQGHARQLYSRCEGCRRTVCRKCWDASAQSCTSCNGESARAKHVDGAAPARGGGALCPNCQAPTDGGRFCGDCGFDLAGTHMSCPGCGTLVARQARFCADCGHGF